MKILITGSNGYIGSVLSQQLLAAQYDVVGVDTGFYREGALYNPQFLYPKTITKDIRLITVEDLEGVDVVVHLAELSNDPLGENNPEVTFEINHLGSVALAKTAKKAGVKRFVYTSSCSVYGEATEPIVDENSKPNPQTAYAKCKILVEHDVAELADANFCPVFLRNATVYGASPNIRFDLVVNNLSGLAWTLKKIVMTSDGTPWRPLVHIQDVCQAIRCVIEAPTESVIGETFNVGQNSGNYQIKEVAAIIADTFPGCELTLGSSDGDTRSYKVNFDKIHAALPSYQCKWDVKKGAEELKRIFEYIQMSEDIFKYRPYTRLKQLKHLISTNQLTENFFWKSL
ncbi:MAG: SDR family oxidoreductase [Microgenomates group bacterium]